MQLVIVLILFYTSIIILELVLLDSLLQCVQLTMTFYNNIRLVFHFSFMDNLMLKTPFKRKEPNPGNYGL